jgi:hypothetical protein
MLAGLALLAAADTLVSSHNEEQAAIKAAGALLQSRGCEQYTWSRTKQVQLFSTDDLRTVRLEGNNLTFVCLRSAGVTVSWTAPTAREDGTPLNAAEIAGYTVHMAHATAADRTVETDATSVVVEGLEAGEWQFAVSTTDTEGVVGSLSGLVGRVVEY